MATQITGQVKRLDWTWYATGPGAGIQMEHGPHAGRMVIPCDHIEAHTRHYFSHVCYSDDRGRTWQLGGSTPQHQVNECEVVEIAGGRLLLNMRNYDRTQKTRKVSISADGGASWGPVRSGAALVEPICQASIRRLSWGTEVDPGVVLFSNPADAESRRNLTVRASRDDGTTWSEGRTLHAGPAAYSCLAVLPDGRVGCLYECGEANPVERLVLARFGLEWLEG
jgi:sialidase-1